MLSDFGDRVQILCFSSLLFLCDLASEDVTTPRDGCDMVPCMLAGQNFWGVIIFWSMV